ncbi:MAG: hypothetical protein FWC57_00425, partial [Endomicrobia bacterium]|nr:hypothetical protein [Endomicrobiia bacterium]
MFKLLRPAKLKKIVASLTAASLLLTVFASGGFAAPAQPVLPAANALPALNPSSMLIPFNLGRITDALNAGNKRIIVNIQDLHAHEETQRNISSILSMLDAKYGINRIYLEGAAGQLDTSWLAGIKDENFKNAAIDALLRDGKLTGAELYSIKTGKTKILYGMENKELYLGNFKRLGEIYKKRGEIKAAMPVIKLQLENAAQQYYGKENKKFLRMQGKYQSGKLSSAKYLKHLVSKASESGVNLFNYPAITDFAKIAKIQSSFNANKINSQLSELMNGLKSSMPYSQYKTIADFSGKDEQRGTFYLALSDAYYKYGNTGKYAELEKFFDFIRLNQSINPIDLVNEEKQLARETMYRFAKTNGEKEIIFLSDMFASLSDYLDNKISARDYEFFEKNLPEFKTLWEKYVDVSGLPELTAYYDLFDEFYKVNVERNRYFLEQITGKLPEKAQQKVRLVSGEDQKSAAALLDGAKGIDVVITGGFHTNDLAKLMGDNGYSYVVITPNVTQDTALSDKNYENNILEQAAVANNTFKDMVLSSIFNFSAKSGDPAPSIVSRELSFQLLEAAEKTIGLDAFKRVFTDMVLADAQEFKQLNVENIVLDSIAKEGASYKIKFSYVRDGQKYDVEKTIRQEAENKNYDVKEQKKFNIAGAAVVSAAAILLSFFSLPAGIALGIAGLLFHAAGYENAHLVDKAVVDFKNYASHKLNVSPDKVITKTDALRDMELFGGLTQEEYLKRFEEKIQSKDAFLPALKKGITLKSMFDETAPYEVKRAAATTFATVSKSVPNVIYVNPIALYFLDGEAPYLSRIIISKHEQLHVAGGKGIIASIARFIDMRTNGYMHIAERWDDIHASVASAYGISAVSRGILAFFSDTNSERAELNEYAAAIARVKGQIDRNKDKNIDISAQVDEFITAAEKYLIRIKAYPQFTVESLGTYNRNNEVLNNIAELTGYINAVAVYRQGILTNPEETATRLKKIAQGWQYGLGGSIGLKQDYPAVYDKSVKAEEILSIGYMKAKLTEDIKDFLFNLEINTQKEAKSYEEVIDKAEKFMDNSESLFGLLENSTQPEDLDTINEMWNALPYAMKIIKSFSLKDYRTRELAVRMQSLWEASASFLANNGRSQKADQDTEAIMAITDASLSIGGPIKNIFKFFSFGKLAKDKNGKLDKSGRTIGEKFYDENIAPWREMFMVAAAAGREQGKEWFLGKHTAYNRAVSIVKALDIVSKHDNLTAKEYWESFTADDHIKFNKAKELLAKYSAEEIKNAPDLKKEFEKGWETITANAKENAVYKLYSGHIQFIANLALAVAGALEHRRWNKQQWAEGKPESALSLLGNFTFSDGALYTMISGIVLFIVGSVRIDSLYNEKKSGLTYMDKYDIGDKKDYREYREYMDERIKNDRNKYLIYLSIPMMIFGAIFAGFSAGVWSFMGWGLILVSAFAFLFYHNMKDDYWFEDLAVSYFITAVITIMLGIGLVIGTPIVVNKKMEQNRKIALETIKKYTVESGSSAESFDYTLLELLNDMEKQIFSSTKYNFSEEDRIKIYELLKSGTNLDYAQIAGYLEEKIPGQKWKILKSLQNWGIETGVSHTYKYQTAMRDKEVKKLILEKQNIKVFRQIDYELLQAIDKLEDTLNSGFNVRYRFSNEECVRIYELVKNGSYENIADYLLAIMPQLQSSETSSETRKKILNDAFNLFNIFHSAGNLPSDMTFNAIRTAVTKYYIETGLSTDIIDYEILQKMNNLTNRLSLYLTAGTSINPHEFSNEEYVKIYKLAENKDYEAIISYIANKKGKELYETIINSFVKETFYLEKIPAQLTLDSTKKAYIDKLSRILGSRSRAEKFAASKLGTKILIAAFAPFFERKHLMRIMDAFMSSAEDNVKVYDMDEAKEFLGGHAAYDEAAHVLAHPTGVLPSELAAAPNIIREYQKGLDYVIQPSLRAFYAAWKLTGSMFAARLAANIANVITHFFWNLTHPGKALTVDTNNDIDFSSPENKKALSNLVKKLLLDAGLGKYEDWVINDSIEGNSVTIAGHSVYVRADKYWQLISFTTKQIAGGKTICYINRDGSIENSLSEALRTKEDIKREVSRFDFDGDEERNDKLTAEIVQIITDLINESNRVLPVDAEKEKADLLKEKEELAGIASKSGSYAEFISNIAHHKAFDKPRTRQSLITKENYTKKDHKPYYGAYDVEPKGDIWAQVNDQDHIVKRNYIAPLKFHISANVNNSQKIYDLVKPVLDKYNVAYKVPIKLKYLEELNNGWEYGKTQIGKFMTIYLPGGADERVLLDLAIELDAILIQYNFKSPEIANNMVIGSSGILYVRDERRDVEDGRYGPAELDFRDAFDKRKKELLAIWDKNGAGTTKNADNNAGLTADSTKRAFEKWIDRMVKRAGNSSVNEAVEEAIQEFDKKFGVESESIDPNIKSLLKSIILKRIDDNWRLMRNGELPWPSELMYDSVLKEFYAPVYEARAIAKIALAADADEYWIQTLILWYPDVDDNLEPEAVETARIMLSRDKAVTKEKFEHVRDIVKIMSSLGIKIDENSIRSVIAAIESKQTEFNAETASGQKAVIKIDDKGAVKEVIIDGKPADLEELRRNALVSENQANENRQITVAKLDDNSQISGEPLPHNAGRGGMTGAAIKMLSEPGKYKVTGVMVDELGNGYGEVRYFNETVSCVELGDFLKELKEAGYEDLPVVELIMEVSKDAKGNIKREITKIAQRDVEKAGSVYIWKKSKDETAAKKIKGKNDSKIAESLTLNFSDETRKLLLSLGYGIKEIEKLTPKQIQRVEQLSKLLSDLGIRVNKKAVEFAMNYHNIEIEELAQYKNAAEFKELFSGDYDISALTSGRMRRLSMMWSAGLWQNTNENKEVNIQINEAYIEIADNTPKLLPKDFDELIEKFKKYKSENSENKSQFEELLTVYSKYVAEFTPDKIEKIKIFSSFAGGKLTEQIVRSALYSPLNSTDFENFIQEQTKNEPWFKELFSGKYYVDRLIIKDINAASAEFEKYKESGKHEIRPVLAQIEGRAAPTAISLGIYNTETKEFVWQAKNPKRTAGTPNGVLYTSDSTMKHYKTSEAGRRAVEKARKTEEGKKIVDEGLKNNLSKEEIDDRIIIEILAPKYEARTIAKIAELVSIGMITAEQILSGDFLPGSLVG